MTQHYSDPHALPDIEVFYMDARLSRAMSDEDDEPYDCGWYWWACFPGCMPDGGPMGPFETEQAALADAQDND